MAGFMIAYSVIAGVAAKFVATWSVRSGLATTWSDGFKASFVVCFVALWLGHELVW